MLMKACFIFSTFFILAFSADLISDAPLSEVCEGKKKGYTIHLTDVKTIEVKPGCTYSVTLRSGSCSVTMKPTESSDKGYICFDQDSLRCDSVTEALSGSVTEDCKGTPRNEPLNSGYEFSKEFSINNGIVQANGTVRMFCDGENPPLPRKCSFSNWISATVGLIAIFALLFI